MSQGIATTLSPLHNPGGWVYPFKPRIKVCETLCPVQGFCWGGAPCWNKSSSCWCPMQRVWLKVPIYALHKAKQCLSICFPTFSNKLYETRDLDANPLPRATMGISERPSGSKGARLWVPDDMLTKLLHINPIRHRNAPILPLRMVTNASLNPKGLFWNQGHLHWYCCIHSVSSLMAPT